MCQIVIVEDSNKEIETVQELADFFKVPAESLPLQDCYSSVIADACLCQINISKACDLHGYDDKFSETFDFIISKKT